MNRAHLTWIMSAAILVAVSPLTQAGPAAEAEDSPAGSIIKAKAALKIDGILDEADWGRAEAVSVNYVWGKKDVLSKEPRMVVKYLWDDYYLYIGYEVFDSNLLVKESGEMQGPKGNKRQGCEIWTDSKEEQPDIAEFFLIFNDHNMFWELHHSAQNQFNDVLCLVNLPHWKTEKPVIASCGIYFGKQEYVQDEGEYTFACAATLKPGKNGKPSTVNKADDRDGGYFGEIRLPWYGLGAPVSARTRIEVEPRTKTKPAVTKVGPWKMAGREVSLLAVVQNGTIDDRYHTSCSDLSRNFFHMQTAKYSRYRIVE